MPTDLRNLLRAAFRWTDPGAGSEYLVSDRSGWWRDPTILDGLGPALAGLFPGAEPTVVLAPEVTGFLVGPLVARAVGAGFVEVYREGVRLPIAEPMTWAEVPADHRDARQRLGLRTRLLGPADRVLVVDDWVATGAQARAVHALAAARGAKIIGTAAIVAECDPASAAELNLRSMLTDADLDAG
ncbi:phosphoribosyltransferase family protein [Krasilnikovia sp. MM14-A1259]|uniref:phosphoribosyltransferase family protein n=1 Tax=Krasilnikovia sp. MM14-A1259 TaxID=3373539 RepID=UPI00380E43E9